jgi:hypothetical protein
MQQCVNGLFTMTWVVVGVGAWICMSVDLLVVLLGSTVHGKRTTTPGLL